MHDEIVDAWAAGYEAGCSVAAEALRERLADFAAQDTPAPRKSYEDRVAERIALFEQNAHEFAASYGRVYKEWYGIDRGYDPPTNAESPHLSAGFRKLPAPQPAAIRTAHTQGFNERHAGKMVISVYETAGAPHI